MQKLESDFFQLSARGYFVDKVYFNFVYLFRLQNTVILRLSNCCQSSAAATPIEKTRRGSRLQKWLAQGTFHKLKKSISLKKILCL